ncbi:hypothetical protein X943_002632 [Babesia divergens]|uniref:Uncharacterized protein n=1 Tax=Babesia divergens TaxID=32595 RepID=A0AAD9G7E0_BABDI|nr:hypothetical protein X943_002632 [Babesia divergens]
MSRDEPEPPMYLRNKSVFKYGTIQRSTEEVEEQRRMQNSTDTPVVYELITFENGPLAFSAIVFLPPGDTISMKIESQAQTKFKSMSDAPLTEADVKVFARVVLEDGGRRYVPLPLMDIQDRNWLTFVYNLDENDDDTTIFVDRVLVAGRIRSASYVMFKTKDDEIASTWTVAAEEETIYFGNNVLDVIKSDHAASVTESVTSAEWPTYSATPQQMPLSHLRKYTESSTCNTLFELRESAISSDREGLLVQNLVGKLKHFLNDEWNAREVEELKELCIGCYKYTTFKFFDNISSHEIVSPVLEKTLKNLKFDVNDVYFGVLNVLVYDCDVAYKLMFDMGFGKSLVERLISASDKRLMKREYMLDLVINIISHGKCMRGFLNADLNRKTDSLCDMLILGAAALPKFSMDIFKRKLEDIGKRCELFLALSNVEELYRSVEPQLTEHNGAHYEYLESLLHGVNEAILMVELHHTGKLQHTALRDITEVRQYAVSYVMETALPTVLTGLMKALLMHLERFPVAPIHITTMLEKPIRFISQYNNLSDFGDCLLHMSDICNYVNGMLLNNALHNGIYANSPAEHFKVVCERMAVETIVLKMASKLLAKSSCPQIVSAMYRICMEYHSGYKAVANILAEDSVIESVLRIIESAINGLKPSTSSFESPQENMELWQLLKLVCDSLINDDTGKLLHYVGKKFLPHLEAYLQIFVHDVHVIDHSLQPLQKLHKDLQKLYTSPALALETTGGRLFDSVELYLKDLLDGSGFTLHPSSLKQSFIKASHMNTMSLVSKKLCNGIFLSDPKKECTELGDVHWTHSGNYLSRAMELGVSSEKNGHYKSCYLFVAPPEPIPEHVRYGIRLLSFAGTMDKYISVFGELLSRRENSETLMRLWVHAVASVNPDSDTVLNVEMGAFKSQVGYQWFISSENAIPVITSIVQVVYAAMHYLSYDTYYEEEADEVCKVSNAPLRYVNDDMLTLIILSITGVMGIKRWGAEERLGHASRKCIVWLCKLMSYWYLRYQKSQGYLMNKLMAAYVSLPKMADGVAMLIVSCGPIINPNCDVEVAAYKEGDEGNKPVKKRTRVIFEGKEYTIAHRHQDVALDDDVPNASFWGLIKRIESLKVPVLADFMCSVASKCYVTNPCTLVLTSELAQSLITNDVPLMALLCSVADKCLDECIKGKPDPTRVGNLSGKAYKLITFWVLVTKALVSNGTVDPEIVLKVNYWVLQLFNKYARVFKTMTEGCCRVLFEGYTYVFQSHNKLLEAHRAILTNYADFNKYIALINGAVCWICQILNECKAKDTETLGNEAASDNKGKLKSVESNIDCMPEGGISLSWESILVGFVALKYAFKFPFTALNMLYTVLSGYMDLIVKIINKQIDSEIIKVTPSTTLRLNSIVRQLCDVLMQHTSKGAMHSDAPLQLMILQLVHDICMSIHQTGSSQDGFIFSLIQGTMNGAGTDILNNEDDSNAEDIESIQQEDIYSDIVTATKAKVHKRAPVVNVTPSEGVAGGHPFKGVTDALESFCSNMATELSSGVADKIGRIAISSQIANAMLLLNAFQSLSNIITTDAMERPPPKSLPGYIFIKSKSLTGLFSYTFGDLWSNDGHGRNFAHSILTRVMRMIKRENWVANTCMVKQAVPGPLSSGDKKKVKWLSRCFVFNGSKEAVEIWKAVRFFAKSKLLFADELMCYAPVKSKKQERPLLSETIRYIRSVSTRAPSKHVDAYESEKAGAAPEAYENTFTHENIEKAVAKLNGVITSQTWLDFDNDLVTNGLNLRSILMNPGILKDYSARATFLNALSRHMLIKELLISVGVDVR